MENKIYCSKCGTENNATARFCHKCGETFNHQTQYENVGLSTSTRAKNNKGSGKKIALMIVILIVVAGAAGAGVWWYLDSQKVTEIDLMSGITEWDVFFDGIDGEGEVHIENKELVASVDYDRNDDKQEEFMQTVTYSAEPAYGLSNGDIVEITASYSSKAAERLNITVKNTLRRFEVKGLEEQVAPATSSMGNTAFPENEDYILPYSSEETLTETDLEDLTGWELLIARNEIYARHGYIFRSNILQDYFEAKDWYVGETKAKDFKESTLSPLETKNAYFILRYEKNK